MLYHSIHGTEVPALGFGTFRLPGAACYQGVQHALALGYRHIDTAQLYGNEEEVGAAIKDAPVPRADVFLTTKVWHTNLAPAKVRSSTEESLRKLQTDYVDLLLIHWPTPNLDLATALDAMHLLQAEGKVRHIGVSNFPSALMREAIEHAPIFCNQVEYHPYLSQAPLLDLAHAHDVLITAYRPTANGKLNDEPLVRDLAATYGKTPMQIALRWLIQQDKVATIPKSANSSRRAENFAVFDFALTADEMAAMHALASNERFVDPPFAPVWDS